MQFIALDNLKLVAEIGGIALSNHIDNKTSIWDVYSLVIAPKQTKPAMQISWSRILHCESCWRMGI